MATFSSISINVSFMLIMFLICHCTWLSNSEPCGYLIFQLGTRNSYNIALAQLSRFLKSHKLPVKFPVNPGHILLFMAQLKNDGAIPATVQAKLSAISYFHKLVSLHDPTHHFLVQKAMSGLKKSLPSRDNRLPVTIPLLQSITNNLHMTTQTHYYESLFSAMFTVSFFAFCCPGEITKSPHNILLSQLKFNKGSFDLKFNSFKHSKGNPVVITLQPQQKPPCPVSALRKFLTKRGDKKGPLFCHPDNSPITYSQFNSALADILTYLGGEAKINLHSFRIGAASWAAMNGFTELQIKHLGRWKSDAFHKYIRIQSITIQGLLARRALISILQLRCRMGTWGCFPRWFLVQDIIACCNSQYILRHLHEFSVWGLTGLFWPQTFS